MFLQELKKGKNIFVIILLIFLLVIPLYNNIYHTGLYYIIVLFLLTPLTFYRIFRSDFLEKRFYNKWRERRKKGRLVNIIIESLKNVIFISAMVFGSQYIVNGRTPSFIYSEIPINVNISLMVLVLVFGVITGIITWYENEKRYDRYRNT